MSLRDNIDYTPSKKFKAACEKVLEHIKNLGYLVCFYYIRQNKVVGSQFVVDLEYNPFRKLPDVQKMKPRPVLSWGGPPHPCNVDFYLRKCFPKANLFYIEPHDGGVGAAPLCDIDKTEYFISKKTREWIFKHPKALRCPFNNPIPYEDFIEQAYVIIEKQKLKKYSIRAYYWFDKDGSNLSLDGLIYKC